MEKGKVVWIIWLYSISYRSYWNDWNWILVAELPCVPFNLYLNEMNLFIAFNIPALSEENNFARLISQSLCLGWGVFHTPPPGEVHMYFDYWLLFYWITWQIILYSVTFILYCSSLVYVRVPRLKMLHQPVRLILFFKK